MAREVVRTLTRLTVYSALVAGPVMLIGEGGFLVGSMLCWALLLSTEGVKRGGETPRGHRL